MSEFNYGEEANASVCPCGKHTGVGEWSHVKRAALYKHKAKKTPAILTRQQRAYLESYELAHGQVEYEIRQVGISTGSFNSANKGLPVMGVKPYNDVPLPSKNSGGSIFQ